MNWQAVIKGEMVTEISDQLGVIRVAQGLPEGGDKATAALLPTAKTQRQPRCPP